MKLQPCNSKLWLRDKILKKSMLLLVNRNRSRRQNLATVGPREVVENQQRDWTQRSGRKPAERFSMRTSEGEIKCKFCDKKHPRSREKCPAWGRKSAKCEGGTILL